ncbi:unnamed protein product [Closterium sp. Naga37s-1]|nr:unnamed protein product [Closterium sp. Naga37s-1]
MCDTHEKLAARDKGEEEGEECSVTVDGAGVDRTTGLYRSITTFATLHRMHLATQQQQQQRTRRQASSKGAVAGRGAPLRPPSMGLEQVGVGVQ